jgi:hypothetical protein
MKGEKKTGKDKREVKKRPVSLRKGIQTPSEDVKGKNFNGIATKGSKSYAYRFAILLVLGICFFINAARQDFLSTDRAHVRHRYDKERLEVEVVGTPTEQP